MKNFSALTVRVILFSFLRGVLFPSEIIVGAFYYPWWRPDFFSHTVAKPAILKVWTKEKVIDFRRFPVEIEKIISIFGKYNTSIPQVAKIHIEQAQKGGIDLFALEWTGPYPTTVPGVTFSEHDIEKGFLPAIKDFSTFRFCIFYDQTIRMFWKHLLSEDEAYNFDNKRVRDTFFNDMIYISRKYFHHPNYFKIDGKPVIWLYLTRIYKGDFKQTFKELRESLKGNIYFIADELFSTHPIEEDKIKIFNGIGCYGTGLDLSSIDEVNSREIIEIAIPFYDRWKQTVERTKNFDGESIKFIYSVVPQFEDDHIPGRPLHGDFHCDSPEDFEYVCKRIKSLISSNDGIVFVTSFNEWYETTAVEECFTPSMPFRYNWGDSFLLTLKKVFKKEQE